MSLARQILHTIAITVIASSLAFATAALVFSTHADINSPDTSDAVRAPAEPAEDITLTNEDIDYFQWVLRAASSDKPLSFFTNPKQREDIEYARKLTEDERFDLWFGLEMLRSDQIKIDINPRKNADILG